MAFLDIRRAAALRAVDLATSQLLDRAVSFVEGCLDERGVSRARIAVDPSFRSSFSGREARERLRRELGCDIGFDMGDEAFSAMLALTLLPAPVEGRGRKVIDRLAQLVEEHRQGWRFRFFFDPNGFPADTDCTAVASGALYERGVISSAELLLFARELLRAAAPADYTPRARDDTLYPGVVMVYWEDGAESGTMARGRKHDAVVCAHALYTLKLAEHRGLADAGQTVDATLRFVVDHLISRRFLEGTRYYPSPDAFLYASSRLCARFPECHSALAGPLREALREHEARIEAGQRDEGTRALDLAQRIIVVDNFGSAQGQTRRRTMLARQQLPDGSWPAAPFYRLGRHPVHFGSTMLTTLFAIRALQTQPVSRTGA